MTEVVLYMKVMAVVVFTCMAAWNTRIANNRFGKYSPIDAAMKKRLSPIHRQNFKSLKATETKKNY